MKIKILYIHVCKIVPAFEQSLSVQEQDGDETKQPTFKSERRLSTLLPSIGIVFATPFAICHAASENPGKKCFHQWNQSMNIDCDIMDLTIITFNTKWCIPLADFLGQIEIFEGLNCYFTQRYFSSLQTYFNLQIHYQVSFRVQVKHTKSVKKC